MLLQFILEVEIVIVVSTNVLGIPE
jgi:hypothetical protein